MYNGNVDQMQVYKDEVISRIQNEEKALRSDKIKTMSTQKEFEEEIRRLEEACVSYNLVKEKLNLKIKNYQKRDARRLQMVNTQKRLYDRLVMYSPKTLQ